MNIKTTATCITLEEGPETFLLLEKLTIPDYQNVTARTYITFYYKEGETMLWPFAVSIPCCFPAARQRTSSPTALPRTAAHTKSFRTL